MRPRTWLTAAAIAGITWAGAAGLGSAHEVDPTVPDCVGQHVSMLVREFGGMAAATAHHNQEHGSTMTVGQHLQHIQEMCRR